MIFKFVIRNIRKRPFLSFVKIVGLVLGLSGILFIALFLKNELTFDTQYSKADRIYRFTTTDPKFMENSHFAREYYSEQIPILADFFPEVESYVRLSPMRGGVIMHNEKYFSIDEAFGCDSTFFDIFEADLLIGDKLSVLNDPGSMVVSESFAQRVFGDADPIGQIMTLPAGQYYGTSTDYTVKGIFRDFPQNSHFHPDLVTTPVQSELEGWAYCYLLLGINADPDNIISGYTEFLAKQTEQSTDIIETKAYLQKIADIHLHSNKLREIENNGDMANIYVLMLAGLVLLLISIGNFASLTYGMASLNNKFLVINKVLGSSRNENLKYFFLESFIIISVAIILVVLVSIPTNIFIRTLFNIDLLKGNIPLVLIVITIFGMIGLTSGLQPVFKPKIRNLFDQKNHVLPTHNKIFVSKGAIISQYCFTIILISAVFIISRQTNFVLNNSMGMAEDNIICFESVHSNVQQKFEIYKNELLKFNTIESVSAMMSPPGGEANDAFSYEIEGKENNQKNIIGVFPCDYSFAQLFDLKFQGGENFSKTNIDVEGSGEYIINETAMHYLGYSDPDDIVGKNFKLDSPTPGIDIPRGKIIGVVEDFHLSTMKNKVNPLVMFKRNQLWLLSFVIAYKPSMRDAALTDIENLWKEMFPDYPFSFEPVEALYHDVYKTELLQAKLLSVFTIISLFICSMGLLGLSLLITKRKVKEIGVRKVNGAKTSEIIVMLNKDFVEWVSIAFVVAIPIAYYAMYRWLDSFVYKTPLSWWVFVLAGLLALGIALLTVSWQSWRAATRNPVEALRYE